MISKLTKENLFDLQYFWKYKGDLERLTIFEELKPTIEAEKPEVLKAWNDYKASLKILDLVMEELI